MTAPRPLAVVDIDGVVADVRHRLPYLERRPKDWAGFFAAADADPAHAEGLAVVRHLVEEGHEVLFLTGRPEHYRRSTEAWLARHGLGGLAVHMRAAGDRRPAAAVKVERLAELGRGRDVAVVVDDDRAVVRALRAAGHEVLHADWEPRDADEEASLFDAQEHEGRT